MLHTEIILQEKNQFPSQDHFTLIGDPCHILEGQLWQHFYSRFKTSFRPADNRHAIRTFRLVNGDAICYLSVASALNFDRGDYAITSKCNGFKIDTTKQGWLGSDSGILGIFSMNMAFARYYTSQVYARDYTKEILDFQKKVSVVKGTTVETLSTSPGIIAIIVSNPIPSTIVSPAAPRIAIQQTLL